MRKIRLALDHTHAGVKHYAGTEVLLPDDVAEEVVRLTGAARLEAELAGRGLIAAAPSDSHDEGDD